MDSFLMSPQPTRKSLVWRLIVSLISISTVFTVIQAQIQFPKNGYYGNNPLLQYRNPQQQSLNPYQPQPYNPYQRLASPYNQIENQVLQGPTTSQFQLRNPIYQAPENALLPSGPGTGSRAISEQALQQGPVRGGFSIRNGSYTLEWEWEVKNPTITFRASRRGIGFVGFAISPSGGLAGADIFIAGIGPTGQTFANDYNHDNLPGGVGSRMLDVSNDYEVLGITESGGYTTARFRRLLDTQDREDNAIINAEQYILWCIGPPSRQVEEYHGASNRGAVRLNLLDPPPRFQLRRPIR